MSQWGRQFEGIEPLTHKLSLRGKHSRYGSPALVCNNVPSSHKELFTDYRTFGIMSLIRKTC